MTKKSKPTENPSAHAGSKPAPEAEKQNKKAAAAEKKRQAQAAAQARKDEKARTRQEKKEARAARRAKNRRKVRIVLIVLLLLVLALGGAAVWAGYKVTRSERNFPNLYLDGIPVGGLTREETLQALKDAGWEENTRLPLQVTLPADIAFSVDMLESGAMQPLEAAAENAFAYGHSGNWLKNLIRYGRCLLEQNDLTRAAIRLDEEYIRRLAHSGVSDFLAKTEDKGYTVDREKAELTMMKSAGKMLLDEDKLCGLIRDALLSGQKTLAFNEIQVDLTPPDFDAMYAELAVEPRDAYFEEGTFQVIDEVIGCSFDVKQARELWDQAMPTETVTIPLTITVPEHSGEELRSLLYRDRLGTQTTSYGGSSGNRCNNIRLAAERINGIILLPDEVFSYNGTVGQRTKENGFLEAGAYADGEVVQEVGGGICQVSSTLYCAVMYANLKTVQRTSHYFPVGYLPWGQDATVSWPNVDFRFRNDREYPVKIVAWANDEDGMLTVEIWGTALEEQRVDIRYDLSYVYDEEYPDVVVGFYVTTVRNVYDGEGNYLYTTSEPDSVYHKHAEDIEWPPEKLEADAAEALDGIAIVTGDVLFPPVA
ncbi:MAG: VanW family protein [Oscillospiraceae bacterium]|nr:VanW family protein [Oscillospiraceae bacterium]